MTEESLFALALEKPGGAERQAFLDEACGGDAALRERVERLLAADEQPSGILDNNPASAPTAPTPTPESLTADRVFGGRFKLRQKLGEGGMGEVWVADQTEPVQRRVALKVVRPGQDSARLLARFDQERQALALMDHPNIARVLDAGVADGRPYFVMELIKGEPITAYCDAARLSPRERLELFLPVCHAIQHAHQKGIIHRDLKPSNILIGLYDGKPVPKVIDFGVAKATGPRLTEKSIYTEVGALIGTLEYMSPEQAELNNLDVDTRSDVYSLGAVLYELLTGTVPFSRKDLQASAFTEMLRIIKELEPPKPSTRLSGSGTLPNVAAVRQTEPRKLVALVRGELDWVVMKCLEKDRGRRYATANALATDLQRYLADEPVVASPPSTRYRLGKLVRRHRLLLATAAGFVGLLVAAATVATWLAVRATRAEASETGHRRNAEHNERVATEERNKAIESSQAAKAALKEERFTSYTHRIALAHREWSAGEVASARRILAECPADLRDWEWRYVRRLCDSELVAFRDQVGSVFAVAFSPDGRRIASASRAEVRVWDAATGKKVFHLPGTTAAGVSFHPDGKRLAVAWAGRVTIHDAADGKELLQIDAHDGPAKNPALPLRLLGVAYSPDGKRLATVGGSVLLSRGSRRGGDPAALKIWDADNGKELLRFVDPPRPIPRLPTGLAYSPDGSYLAVSTAEELDEREVGEVIIRDTTDGRLLHTLTAYPPPSSVSVGASRSLTGVAFSRDSRRVAAAGSDAVIRVWELPAGRPVQTLAAPPWRLAGLAFSPTEDRLVAVGGDRIVRSWDTATGKETDSLFGHDQQIHAVAFSPDGRRIASAGGSEVRVWDATTAQQAHVFRTEFKGDSWANRSPFSYDGRFLALVSRQSVRIRELATGEERRLAAPTNRDGPIAFREAMFSPDGTTFATTGANGVTLWDVAKGTPVRVLPNHPKEGDELLTFMDRLAFSPDGQRLATVASSFLTIWETATGRVVHKVRIRPPFNVGVGGVAYSPDGNRVAVAIQVPLQPKVLPLVEVKVWDAESGRELTPIAGGGYGLAFSPDGTRLVSGNLDGTVTVWNAVSGAVEFTLRGHTAEVTDVAFSRDGRRLVTASADMTVRLWDPSVGKEVLVLRGHGGKVAGVRFSLDGHYLASVSLGQAELRLWDARPVGP